MICNTPETTFSWSIPSAAEPGAYIGRSYAGAPANLKTFMRESPAGSLNLSDSGIWGVTFVQAQLDDVLILTKNTESVIQTWDGIAGDAVTFTLPNNCILFYPNFGWMINKTNPFFRYSCQKTFTEQYTSNTYTALAGAPHGSGENKDGNGDDFANAGFFTVKFSDGISLDTLNSRGFITDGIFNFKFTHIVAGSGFANIALTCLPSTLPPETPIVITPPVTTPPTKSPDSPPIYTPPTVTFPTNSMAPTTSFGPTVTIPPTITTVPATAASESCSVYPEALDTDDNLFVVHDSLRLQLANEYNPGDTSISVLTSTLMDVFPPSGIITLTEQCSEISKRAISFKYSSHDSNNFYDLVLLDDFTDCEKPAIITDITQNVMAEHHNCLKDALISIENFVGTKGSTDLTTIAGRLNYLRQIVYTPRAWFGATNTIGMVPLTVEFQQQCFRLGDDEVTLLWNFGDETSSSISFISTISVVPSDEVNVMVYEDSLGPITKTYNNPGIFDVTLTVSNQFGEDSITIPDLIDARIEAPNEAQINITPNGNQLASAGNATPLFNRLGTEPGGPWNIPPTIRSAINTFISLYIPPGNLNADFSYAGEPLNGMGDPIDPIQNYTWSLSDDLEHSSASQTLAAYSVGGIYDIVLRCDTEFGSYRITEYVNCIDIIEQTNFWLFTFQSTGIAIANEYGLLSETFKVATRTTVVTTDNSFLNSTNNATQAKAEFARNTGFIPASGLSSGSNGDVILAWAGGGSPSLPLLEQSINTILYNAFSDSYSSTGLSISRPWNWALLASPSESYFLFGPYPTDIPNTNLSYQGVTTLDLLPSPTVSNSTLTTGNYLNGAGELQELVTSGYDTYGEPLNGRFAVNRTAWQANTGYLLRNSNVGVFFRISNFYCTVGTLSTPFVNLNKLPDIPGSPYTEGQLVSLSSGVLFFNNSGNVAAFNSTDNSWTLGGASSSSATFRSVQDSTVPGYDNTSNTLLAASDHNSTVFLSYDYSVNAFIKFNGIDMTFTNQGSRPTGTQWLAGIW